MITEAEVTWYQCEGPPATAERMERLIVEDYLDQVRQSGYALMYIPWERRTFEVCLAAVRILNGYRRILRHVRFVC